LPEQLFVVKTQTELEHVSQIEEQSDDTEHAAIEEVDEKP
jgi:hypothetical protein